MFRAVLTGHRKDLPRSRTAVVARTQLAAEIARVGNNLNQISRRVNQSMLMGILDAGHAVTLQATLLLLSEQLTEITTNTDGLKC
jgi:hypothetical protein